MERYRAEVLAGVSWYIGLIGSRFEQTHSVPDLIEEAIALTNPSAQARGIADQLRDHTLSHTRARAVKDLGLISDSVPLLKLSPMWIAKLERIKAAVDGSDARKLEILITELGKDLIESLKEPLFLCVQNQHQSLYQAEAPFGQEVTDAFPDAKRDIGAAARCLALDEPTACVFHLMRVLEHGLRPIAQRFNVPFATDSWHTVLKGIEDGLTVLRNKQGRSDLERREITYYSEAASEFRHFKDAWRNHVSHAREHYDPRDAETVWTHVKSFMIHLTTKP